MVPFKAALLVISSFLPAVAFAESDQLQMCPIMTDNPASTDYYADYQGLRYYFCCEGCVHDFQSDPSRIANLSTVKGVPVSDGGVVLAATNSTDSSSPGTTKQPEAERTSGLLQSAKEKLAKKADHYCLDSPLVQLHLLTFFVVLPFPIISRIRNRFMGARNRSESEQSKEASEQTKPALLFSGQHATGIVWVLLLVAIFDATYMASRYSNRERRLLNVLAGADLGSGSGNSLDLESLNLIKKIHYSTFADFGFPPRPRKTETNQSPERTYYRGNDERHDEMFNGGQYRTVTFHIHLTTEDGRKIEAGDDVGDERLYMNVQFIRAPFTSSGYYTREYMKRMYLTQTAERFLGRDKPIDDRMGWTEIEDGRVWEARFPLQTGDSLPEEWKSDLPAASSPQAQRGIVYLCEERLDGEQNVLGGRFHFGIQYSLEFDNGTLLPESDVFMGTNYRGANFVKYGITEDQWLSHIPLPEKPGP